MLLWEESLEVVKNTEMRSRIRGVASCMQSFDIFFGVLLSELILRHSEITLARHSSHLRYLLLKGKALPRHW